MRENIRGRGGGGDKEMVLWRCSRDGVRSGQGGIWVLEMELEIGGVPAVIGGTIDLNG
jgi:hypothetical protein